MIQVFVEFIFTIVMIASMTEPLIQ